MHLIRSSGPAVLALAIIVSATAAVSGPSGPTAPAARSARVDREASAEAVNVRQVRSHLDSVLTELGARDLAPFSGTQRARRLTLVRELRAYRDRGVFPHNYDFPGEQVPYFVDRKTGALCAVAALLSATGRDDIVRRVAAAGNNVRVMQLAGDTALARWLDLNGVSLAEAARIQVAYAQPNNSGTVAVMTGVMGVAGITALSTGVWNITGNADGHSATGRIFGMATGAVSVVIGAGLLSIPEQAPLGPLGTFGVVAGGLGMGVRRPRHMGAPRCGWSPSARRRGSGLRRRAFRRSLIRRTADGRGLLCRSGSESAHFEGTAARELSFP